LIGEPFSRDVPQLGFGCAWLSGGRRAETSLRLVEAAFDNGIRYFDIARMYMLGGAEGVLGQFLPKHRAEMVVTSKAGIMPPPGDRVRGLLHRADKVANRVFGKPIPDREVYRFNVFDTRSLRKSVDKSLRELRTDHLDALLLHEVDVPHLADGSVMALLEKLRGAGKIGSFGFASTREQTDRLVAQYGARVPIIQTASTVLEDGLAPLANRGKFFTITHSVLAHALKDIVDRLAGDDAFRKRWASLTGLDPVSREHVAELLLAEALDANRDGVVLFSSTSPARIADAARVARERPYSPEQIAGLRELAAGFGDRTLQQA
jgi:aryl-alcohol dehydrogenase-like predicted oxidoreductase